MAQLDSELQPQLQVLLADLKGSPFMSHNTKEWTNALSKLGRNVEQEYKVCITKPGL